MLEADVAAAAAALAFAVAAVVVEDRIDLVILKTVTHKLVHLVQKEDYD